MSGDYKRLYRSLDERMLAGVCGGIAEYFNVDPTLVRLLFVLFSLAGGPGIVAYIVLAIVVPEEPSGYEAPPAADEPQASVEVELDESE
ncbi:MAG: PspC domain-containing protein [Anaerolineae bacterium]|jgi:phage shock protein C